MTRCGNYYYYYY